MKSLKCRRHQVNLITTKKKRNKKIKNNKIHSFYFIVLKFCGCWWNVGRTFDGGGLFILNCDCRTGKRSTGWRIPITPHAIRLPASL
jgi:hypothetical protein